MLDYADGHSIVFKDVTWTRRVQLVHGTLLFWQCHKFRI